MEILKQNQYEPQPVEKQVVTVFAATNGFCDGYEVSSLGRYEDELAAFMRDKYGDLLDTLREKKTIDDDMKSKLSAALEEFRGVFQE